MTTAERIYTEVKRLPEDLMDRVLDFVLFLEQRHAVGQSVQEMEREQDEVPVLDPRGWHFDREQANAGSAAMAALLANPYPPKGDGLPMKREEIYDRTCLR
ncbi:MAG: hypothetical protein HQL84_10950 [Magnetococcales bacterium]|nr:hypothetical protein [Magnetococcales bacterium]MBF0150550.1 hypothetical protein [Magnetococcales bacterium]MBF0174831.1 hypothetical protein [Magnetococcales bacterium]MBF0348705.1 hypothetical protein [Magnetococcales bacterium]MBF0631767.1 hypothetical protein [Magnetococcales bacterium]